MRKRISFTKIFSGRRLITAVSINSLAYKFLPIYTANFINAIIKSSNIRCHLFTKFLNAVHISSFLVPSFQSKIWKVDAAFQCIDEALHRTPANTGWFGGRPIFCQLISNLAGIDCRESIPQLTVGQEHVQAPFEICVFVFDQDVFRIVLQGVCQKRTDEIINLTNKYQGVTKVKNSAVLWNWFLGNLTQKIA